MALATQCRAPPKFLAVDPDMATILFIGQLCPNSRYRQLSVKMRDFSRVGMLPCLLQHQTGEGKDENAPQLMY